MSIVILWVILSSIMLLFLAISFRYSRTAEEYNKYIDNLDIDDIAIILLIIAMIPLGMFSILVNTGLVLKKYFKVKI